MRKKLMILFTLATVAVATLVAVAFAPLAAGEQETAVNIATMSLDQPIDISEEPFEQRVARIKAEEDARRAAVREEHKANMAKVKERPPRKIQSYRWESSASARAKLLTILPEDHDAATLTAFLRVCIAEADGHASDCIGIWQVIRNNRRRTCARAAPGGKRITECDANGETYLSSLRRHQRHILGFMPLRNRRAAWISKMTMDCENPPSDYHAELSEDKRLNLWDSRYVKRCQRTLWLGRYLMKGELPPSKPGHTYSWLPGRPVTWGGRCEDNKASCDDRIACARGLVRIPDTGTHNAFWERARTPDEVDPICAKMGYGVQPLVLNEERGDESEAETGI